MLIVLETPKTVEEIEEGVAEVCARYQVGVLGSFNLKEKLQEKGVPLERECRVFEICNPRQTCKILEGNMAIAAALPCRIAVYQENGVTQLATIRPTALLSLFPNPELQPVVRKMEEVISRIMLDLV